MNTLKQVIDTELSNIKVTDDLSSNVIKKVKNASSRSYLKVACFILCFLVGGTSVYATSNYLYEKLMVNNQALPEIGAMEVKKVNALEAKKNAADNYEKQFSNFNELQNELGINLLDSAYAKDNKYMLIDYKSDHANWIMIKITGFIIGDVQNLKKVENENIYTYDSGTEYSSPIDLEIDIMTSDEQKKIGWERDYLGYYEFKESYVNKQGIKVNFLEDTVENENILNSSNYRPEYKAILVSDGVRYILSGRVSLDKMKEIVDSMKI